MIAQMVLGPDRAFVTAAQTTTPLTATLAPLRLRGVPAGLWKVTPLHAPRRPRATLEGRPFLARGEATRAAAAVLEHTGLPLPILNAGEIIAFLLSREAG
jgi:hypothetical protein